MISETQKQRILEAIAANRKNYPSDAKHASALGISPSVYNGLKKGQTEKALSDANWVNIARRLDVKERRRRPSSISACRWRRARSAA